MRHAAESMTTASLRGRVARQSRAQSDLRGQGHDRVSDRDADVNLGDD